MKTRYLRMWALAVVGGTSLICAGCAKTNVQADEVPVFTKDTPEVVAADDKDQDKEKTPETKPASTNAEPAATIVQTPTTPKELQVSPGLAEVIKLAQAGVSEDIILTYVTNSANIYNVGSAEIVYLNDLGVSSTVIRELIRKDNSSESLERKRALTAASPLPPGVALNSPATNIYYNTPLPRPATMEVPADGASVEAAPPTAVATAEPTAPPAVVAQSPNAAYFYDSLSPYGNWVQVENYGLCWQPTVAVVNSNWRPYGDHGRWYWSDAGWYWYSDYSWGWAPFHYGRWCSGPRLGWFWVPDRVWGPSWVTWRYNDSYCGWAPLPPYTHYSSGVGLVWHNSAVSVGFGFNFGYSDYCYVPWTRFHDHSPHRHFAHHREKSHIYHNSKSVNNYAFGNKNTVVNEGFGLDRAARRSGTQIAKLPIRTAEFPADRSVRAERLVNDGSSLAVVRPELSRQPNRFGNATPAAGRTTTAVGGGGNSSSVPAIGSDAGARGGSRSSFGNANLSRQTRPSTATPASPAPSANGGVGAGAPVDSQNNQPAVSQSERRNLINPETRSRIARTPFQPGQRPSVPSGVATPAPNNSTTPIAPNSTPNTSPRTGFGARRDSQPNAVNRPGNSYQPPVSRPQANVNATPVPNRSFQTFSGPPVRREAPQMQAPVQRPSVQQSAPQQSAPAMRSAPAPQQSSRGNGGGNSGGGGGRSQSQQRPSRFGGN